MSVPGMKPHIYKGVYEGLGTLSKKYPLFLLGNCEKGGVVELHDAHWNDLQYPLYIGDGDTDSDSKVSSDVDEPFVFVTYGFGKTNKYTYTFDLFPQLVDFFLDI